MKSVKMLVVLSLALALGACQGTGPKQAGGTVVGGALGGLAGSQIGGGKGQLAATAAGAILGAILGSEVGKSMDELDQMKASQAFNQAGAAPIGQTIHWNNPDSGHTGSVTPVRDGTSASGQYCREFQQTVDIGGQKQQAYGTACRQPDGSWQIVQN